MLRRQTMKKVSPVPPYAPPPVATSSVNTLVYADFNRRTCIEVKRTGDRVDFIPFDAEEGLQVRHMHTRDFDHKFKLLLDYPVERAAKLYIAYATNLGATRDALKYLGEFTHLSEGEISMATAKKTAADTKKAVAADKKSTKKNLDDKIGLEQHDAKDSVATTLEKISKNNKKLGVTDKPAAKAPEPKKADKPAPAAKPDKAPRTSAAQMFKDLIMEGKLTDQQIFHKVQAAFDLDDSKAGYVKWYRNNLKKTGQNPPAEKK